MRPILQTLKPQVFAVGAGIVLPAIAQTSDDEQEVHNRGPETFVFRHVGRDRSVLHTHSSSRPVDKD